MLQYTPLQKYLYNYNFLTAFSKFAYVVSFVVLGEYWCVVAVDVNLIRNTKPIPVLLDYFFHGGGFILNFIDHILRLPFFTCLNFKSNS